ncbi:MAG: multicopper oxidase domain-containing protein [Acidobacteriia bacterium]|nr:multicopper oxidase domain-containing protein [Terriglobia bacterium]
MNNQNALKLNRRDLLKLGISAGGLGLLSPNLTFAQDTGGGGGGGGNIYTEVFPISPLIGGNGVNGLGKAVGSAFTDPLPIPAVLAPIPKSVYSTWSNPPGPGVGQQSSDGSQTHQIWPSTIGYPDPLVYQIKLQVRPASFTSLKVMAIDKTGAPTTSFDETKAAYAAGAIRNLPQSVVYGFNGLPPTGTRINAEYGKPCLVRFENHLDENPYNLDRQDFGAPDYTFLTHLHNGHTAPESDGNPHQRPQAYKPGEWCDNLYLNWPAGNDPRERQSFFWFHDHKMDFTGANVYKGMVGLFPLYNPDDSGDETTSTLRLPGVRTNNPDGTFSVEYDIPLGFYDCRLDDGVTIHHDFHDAQYPLAGDPAIHPEWWGKTYFRHFPNHGFVGDVFTVNGAAYPVLEVKRRKYRFRMLDCSISRIYEVKLMSSTGGPKSAASLGFLDTELQGQYRILDGQQCMKFTEIAVDGGLLGGPIVRDSIEVWPAKRREIVVDFSKYMDGSPTHKGDAIYLTNIMKMPDGRMWTNSTRSRLDPNYKIPMLKFVIGDNAVDNSQIPAVLRELPPFPADQIAALIPNHPVFEVQRGGSSTNPELEWMINGRPFDPTVSLANPKKNSFAVWEIKNGGGGWVHPFHLHMEEHQTVARKGVFRQGTRPPDPTGHPDDVSMEDLVALDPSESTLIYRGFRDFVGPYVAHCHNLAHEDHAMMFGWSIVP